MLNDDCIFCKIIKGKLSADILKESDMAIAIRDINPQSSTHILIIPKIHIKSTVNLNNKNIQYLSEMALLANFVAKEEKIIDDGYRWIINTGEHGGQTVNHIHLHYYFHLKYTYCSIFLYNYLNLNIYYSLLI